MGLLSEFRSLTSNQRNVVIATYLGWTLDAFDFFILVFVLKDVAQEFDTSIETVTLAIMLTLAARPIGALIFGLSADRFGRRPTLMVNILLYSFFEFATGFATSLTIFFILRTLFGVAMGGEWGVGASLTMETIPPRLRGAISGLLQAGYPSGYLLASIIFGVLYPVIGWRGMFMVGAAPALLVFYIRRSVEESPSFVARKRAAVGPGLGLRQVLRGHAGLFLYAVLLMTCFNFFSHGTQDLYPTFLRVQRELSPQTVGVIAVVYNIGAILGGLTFGHLSEYIGRRRAIVIATLLALPIIPLWAFGSTPALLALGAFLIQFAVQGAWGVVPVHLNELSPEEVRGTFPGFAYQLGNLLASVNATLQAAIAGARAGDYAFALALVAGIVAVILAVLTALGVEAHGVKFAGSQQSEA
ncbi:MAG TPA: MFS transporter [Beijerinckia sp.]|jgi:SHS family lactate transporter-like MFS transporter|nr:MFS transporter [Beijerinckia sp.]